MEIFDYDNILLLPRKCVVESRSECDTSMALGHVPVLGEWTTLPLIEAAGGQRGDAVWDRFFHPNAQALLERCDLLLRIGGKSAGADLMVKAALAAGLQVYYGFDAMPTRTA